jgi:DNA-binding CsgD family transcriptional regulator
MNSSELEEMSQLIAKLYDAALNPTDWEQMANRIARWFDIESCGLSLLGNKRQLLERISQTDNLPNVDIEQRRHFFKLDPWSNLAFNKPLGITMNSKDHISDAEILGSEFYNDFFKAGGENIHCLGLLLPISTSGDGIAAIGLHRDRRQGPFSDKDIQKLNLIIPHYQRALQMRRRFLQLSFSQTIHSEALAALATGVIVTDKHGSLFFSNFPAEEVLRAGDQLTIRNGFLNIPIRALNEQLLRMIKAVSNTALCTSTKNSGGWLSIPLQNRRPLKLLVCPLPSALTESTKGAIIFLHNSAQAKLVSGAQLQELYSLTPAEGRLAKELLQGSSLAEYAQGTKISLHTAKNHLRRIFEKTGHTSQIDFIREILSNPLLSIKRKEF